MEVKEYIESGILEMYVFGDLTAAEAAKVQAMAVEHPEIAAELAKIEETLEQVSMKMAIEPTPAVKERIMAKIEGPRAEKPVIPLYPTRLFAYGLAACVTLLLISSVAAFTFWEKWKNAERELVAMRDDNNKIVANMASLREEYTQYQGVLRKPTFLKVHLESTPSFPGNEMMVYWDKQSNHVMIDMMKLPQNDANHQYQLWAIVDGKPVDAGVFDVQPDNSGMLQMKDINNAVAFAVTLEPKGGSVNPTMEQMYVMGKI
ncbi:anti-sigma factor [Solitalea koreensis]|uniref:Regulator of SigK n=1 Tax=Solitalea koreensis TaxID=543615 RepID=A0A521B1E5_9SPHI|nr:anti-sigma factor [Solitalea koreensis]SMO40914.1 Anti-sigma-K factor rskA [Solitalea koreensis]